jgi:hypothetical protein
MQVYALALIFGLLAATVGVGAAVWAEEAPPISSQRCPQDDSEGPSPAPRGNPGPANPSERLADSKGVVCPPTGVDPGIRAKPPAEEGTIKIVPAPGAPGGDPKVQPK